MLTEDAKIDIVNESLKDMVDPRPYSKVKKEDGFAQILTESDQSLFRNAVFWSVFDEKDAEERVRQTVAMYKEKELSFRWVVGPGSEPKNLIEILARNGLQKIPKGFPGAGMIATYDTIKGQKPRQNQHCFCVQVVDHKEQIQDFVRILETCFGMSVGNERFLCAAINDDISAQPRRLWYFLVCSGSAPVGILAARTYGDRFAYLSAGAVLPEFRRKGALKFLGDYVADFLKGKGIATITTQTLPNTSEELCRKLGFETVCQVDTLLSLFNSSAD